jgi:hypothetical protein
MATPRPPSSNPIMKTKTFSTKVLAEDSPLGRRNLLHRDQINNKDTINRNTWVKKKRSMATKMSKHTIRRLTIISISKEEKKY